MKSKHSWNPKDSILNKRPEELDVSGRVGNNPLNADALDIRKFIEQAETWQDKMSQVECNAEFTIEEAANYLGVSAQTLRNWEGQGKLAPRRTEGGHRRYLESQLIPLRKKQIAPHEIILPDIKIGKLKELWNILLGNFSDEEKVQLTIQTDSIDEVVRITIESQDGLNCVTKTFKVED